jgi:tetratricopeptide (TPR) repeat protein
VPFPRDRADDGDEELARDLAIALTELAHIHPDSWLGEMALPLADAAVIRDTNDLASWEARTFALWISGHPQDALGSCQAVLAKDPDRETALFTAAMLALRLNRPDLVRKFAERGLRVNPKMSMNHELLAQLAVQNRDWPSAIKACQQAIDLQPANPSPHRLLIACYLQIGERAKAQKEYELCAVLMPPEQREDLRSWFLQRTR